MRTGFLLAAGCAALLSIGWKERDAAKTPALTISPPRPAKTAAEVADRLDALLQPRFQEQAEDFGLDRIYIPLNAHQYTSRDAEGHKFRQPLYSLIGRSAEEKRLLAEADAPQKEYVVAFLHCDSALGKPGDKNPNRPRLRASASPLFYFETLVVHDEKGEASLLEDRNKVALWFKNNMPEAEKSLSDSAAKARRGEKTSDAVGAYFVALRPVKAQKSCLQCHGKAKTGDTLGVMAYAVKK